MSVSTLAKAIAESPTMKLNEEARLLRERGQPVIHLGIGEPKNKAPLAAILSGAAKLNTGDVKYAPADGTPSLKKAIIRYTEEHYDKVVAPENVIVSSGAKQAIYNLLYTLLNPQDEVIILVAVLGQLPRDGEDGLRRAGAGHSGRRQLLPANDRHREGGDRLHQGHHHQQPEQPLGRHVLGRVHRPGRRLL